MKYFLYSVCFLFIAGLLVTSVYAQVNVTTEFVPTNTTLVWEAESYTPPFYKGKALYPTGGTVHVVAFPPEGVGNPETLTYTWKFDGEVQGDLSGVGRQTFVWSGGLFSGSPLIVVEVSSAAGTHGVGATRIPETNPGILLYQDAPLVGILFNTAFTAHPSNEIAVEAYPLFFSTQTRNEQPLRYTWFAGNTALQNPLDTPARIVVRTENPGTTTLSVRVENDNNLLESARGEMTIRLTE